MENLIWHNEKRKVKDLVPYELNPRILTDEQAEKLKDSLKKFNLVEIPAIDTNNKIVAGHQRIKIMHLSGICSIYFKKWYKRRKNRINKGVWETALHPQQRNLRHFS